MCGIVGIIERVLIRRVPPGAIDNMLRALDHRGPDEEGRIALPGVALAMRRLSIVDVTGGQQPFSSEDGTIHMVANGEIYNFEEVKEELVAKGHRFRSRADVEVIVHAYEEWGAAFLQHIHGMFALAVWDGRTRTLLAARDRAGEKPLYYTLSEDRLLLGSEIKALLALPEVARTLDPEALDQFLTYEYVIAPKTIFSSIRKVPPAHYLLYRNAELTVHRYWDAADVPVREWSEQDAADALRAALQRAVRNQMMSDVPVGVFLSGGIDSSAVAMLMQRETAGQRVRSFSMGFSDGSYDELPYAREVAALCGSEHIEGMVTPDVAGLFDRLVVHMDEPFADVSLFPTFLVSQMAREHVKVVLSGDGGDELFGGYDAYAAQHVAARWAHVTPTAAIRVMDAVLELVPPTSQKKGVVNKARRFVSGLTGGPPDIQQYRWMTFVSPAQKRRLYTSRFQEALAASDVYAPVRAAFGRIGADDLLNRQLYADLCVYLADDILVKVDRMSMAVSLETRAPFLDTEMMELAFSMPGHLKIRNGERKFVLKRALAAIVPPRILQRKKEGFSIPMKNWLRADLVPLMEELLSEDRLKTRGWVNPVAVRQMIDQHKAGRANHAHVLFSLMVFERWAQEYAA